ncbi:hypothetical protein [Parendozoicomonas sp. Alg238-R29]|uniref:hypothetical protein n=1 Tax=Parendozoicomonas sp. Alg238-R29 TaxID=2993446 RepID=UPI00248E4A71|nr:hypothetical protein [Parendozoicomonas sp. Alg238-R29]
MYHRPDARNNPTTTPDQVGNASVTPQGFGQVDHSFTLQAVMELQKSTGQLTSSVESLKDVIEKQDKKITDLESTVTGVSKKIYAATVVLIILVTVGGFIVNKSWDLMVKQITFQQEQNIKTSTPKP